MNRYFLLFCRSAASLTVAVSLGSSVAAAQAPSAGQTSAPDVPVSSAPAQNSAAVAGVPVELPAIEVLGSQIEHNPAGRTIGRVDREQIATREAFSLKDLMETTPGVAFQQSNGPRDITISVRGSGAKVAYGINDIKTYEDWFPTTQSDGLARTDINDPNAYEGIDIIRGPSSALYDDNAIGGVVNFRTVPGRDLDGVDVGSSYGSHGYWNDYVDAGGQSKELEYALFGSAVGSDGYISRSAFHTYTQNFTSVYTPDSDHTIVLKFLNNDVRAEVPSRLTLNQFNASPTQEGTTSVTGVGTVSADQAGQGRDDRRTILGARYEDQLTADTSWRFMGDYDVKEIDQIFGTITQEVNTDFQQTADVTHEDTWLGRPVRTYAGEFYNHMDEKNPTYFNLADYNGDTGALEALTQGYQENMGGRARAEMDLTDRLTGIVGLGAENSSAEAGVQSTTSTVMPSYTRFTVERHFWNAAPEADLIYKENQDLSFHGRVATAYGTPSISQLSTAQTGLAGNNTGLKPQRNLGFELGTTGKAAGQISFDLTGYYEILYDEFVTASPGAGLSSFTVNAPRADHRGIEAMAVWRPRRDAYWSNSYTFNNAVYKTFDEVIGPGVVANRAGEEVPGIERQNLNSRIGYETPEETGTWFEVNWIPPYYVDNANALATPTSVVCNFNAHYTRPVDFSWFKKFTTYFEIHNVLDRKVVGSAIVVADSSTDLPGSQANAKQAFFAGEPLGFYGGVKLAF